MYRAISAPSVGLNSIRLPLELVLEVLPEYESAVVVPLKQIKSNIVYGWICIGPSISQRCAPMPVLPITSTAISSSIAPI